MPESAFTDATVANITERKRYEIGVGGQTAGSARYVDTGNQRIFYRTEVDDKFARHGLGGRLASAALDDTRAAGKRVVALCPFVAAYVDRHEDYDDILDPVTPQAHLAVRGEMG